MKTLVISGTNLTEGGPLTVLREMVRATADAFPDWNVIVAVHRLGISQEPRVKEVEFPTVKSSWLRRLWLEWFVFHRMSRQWRPDVWISMHDMTPRVIAGRQYVYCHNPSPFCDVALPLEKLDRTFRLFRRYYGTLYGCFIGRNRAVIVQQDWLRQRFMQRYGLRRVVVAHPSVAVPAGVSARKPGPPRRFLYPALPRVFKNHELLGECVKMLELDPLWTGEIVMTIDGSENEYAKLMRSRYGSLRSLKFVGLLSPQRLAEQYLECDALIFPSMLETWGLPLTEAKAHGLSILAADLPYAHETVGDYDRVNFFDPYNPGALAALLLDMSLGHAQPSASRATVPAAPFAEGWTELLTMLLVTDAPAEPAQAAKAEP